MPASLAAGGHGIFLAGTYVLLASRANARGIAGAVVGADAGSIPRMPRRN
jgi:hypothetical protein